MSFQQPSTKAETIEVQLIENDLAFYMDLFRCLLPRSKQEQGIISPGLMLFYAHFVADTHAYFVNTQPDYAREIEPEYQAAIRHTRNNIHLFEKANITEILRLISEYQRWYFNKNHRGLLGPLKRALQKDLGLYSYDGHLIGTTHVYFLYLAGERNKSGNYDLNIMDILDSTAYERSVDIGRYFGRLYKDILGASIDLSNSDGCASNDRQFDYRDVKSEEYYETIFNGSGSSEINSVLLMLLTFVNFTKFVIPQLAHGNLDALLVLKFIALYEVLSSIQSMTDFYYPRGLLDERSKAFLKHILSNTEAKMVLRQSKGFRNTVMHYALPNPATLVDKLDLNKRLFGLVEALLQGRSATDLEELTDVQIGRVSKLLEEWLPQKQALIKVGQT